MKLSRRERKKKRARERAARSRMKQTKQQIDAKAVLDSMDPMAKTRELLQGTLTERVFHDRLFPNLFKKP